MNSTSNSPQRDPSEREKWNQEVLFREKELALKEREQEARDSETRVRQLEHCQSRWRNPLVIAVMVAAVAAAGNALVTFVNGTLQRKIENQKSERARILEMIKTGNPDKAAQNLEFLLDAGLISDPERIAKLREFLSQREPGSGPALAPATTNLLSSMTAAEIAAVIKASILIDRMFGDLVILLQMSILENPTPDEERELSATILEIQSSRAVTRANRMAVLSNRMAGKIPTQSDFRDLEMFKRKVESLDGSDPKSLIEVSRRVLARVAELGL